MKKFLLPCKRCAAYLADPNDAVTAAHIGWMHIWRPSESTRLDRVPPTITDDAVLARRYFQEAASMDPHDARFLGFLASATLVIVTVFPTYSPSRAWYEY